MKFHIPMRLLTVTISLYLVSRMPHAKAADQCNSQRTHYDKALKGHTFDKVKVNSPAYCVIRCEDELRCQSFNFVMKDKMCELNNRSKEARPEDYVTDPSRIYMTIQFNRVPLGSISELPAESCVEIKASEGKEAVSGDYWLDQYNTGEATLKHCIMETKAPDLVTAYNSSSTRLIVRWSHVKKQYIHGKPIGYKIVYSPLDLESDVISVSVNYTTNITTLADLAVYTMYVINVSAISSEGVGPANTTKARTGAIAPSRAPDMVTAYNSSSTSLVVSWSHVSKQYFYGQPIGYKIVYSPLDLESDVSSVSVNYTTNTTTLADLAVYTMYVINVSAISSGGVGPAKTTKARIVLEKSCSELKKLYSTAGNGNYVIDPDGEGGLPPLHNVTCDMSDKNGVGVTVISHDSEKRTLVDGCESKGCYSRDIHYTGASLTQLAGLTYISSYCEQFIKYECYNSGALLYDYAWWVSRDSAKMTYWGGADPGSGKCACGMNNTCADPQRPCNCDKDDNEWREDSGLLNEKTHLPVKQLRFGDTGASVEEGYHTLGKFKCYGIA